jgi:hypothetical protein
MSDSFGGALALTSSLAGFSFASSLTYCTIFGLGFGTSLGFGFGFED